MFDTIILLAGTIEHASLASVLRGHHPQLLVHPVFTAADLAAIEPEWLQRARLVTFATPEIVAPEVIDRLGFGAYGFHPGSPRYPDAVPARFALQDQAGEFGATAHRMTSRETAGAIVDVELFPVPQDISLAGLQELALGSMMQMFWRLARPLATRSEPLVQRAMRWSARRDAADAAVTMIQPRMLRGSDAPGLARDPSGLRRDNPVLRAVSGEPNG